MPNKPGPAKDLVKSLKAYVSWQSTLSWLKNPPASYMLPPTDIEGGLDEIGKKAESGGFKSEYEFQLSIFQLIASAHDGHFAFRGDVFKGFSFRNKLASDIVSVSRDGLEVPKLYHLGESWHKQLRCPCRLLTISKKLQASLTATVALLLSSGSTAEMPSRSSRTST